MTTANEEQHVSSCNSLFMFASNHGSILPGFQDANFQSQGHNWLLLLAIGPSRHSLFALKHLSFSLVFHFYSNRGSKTHCLS